MDCLVRKNRCEKFSKFFHWPRRPRNPVKRSLLAEKRSDEWKKKEKCDCTESETIICAAKTGAKWNERERQRRAHTQTEARERASGRATALKQKEKTGRDTHQMTSNEQVFDRPKKREPNGTLPNEKCACSVWLICV